MEDEGVEEGVRKMLLEDLMVKLSVPRVAVIDDALKIS